MLDEEQQLIARLRKIEALFARPGTEGERRHFDYTPLSHVLPGAAALVHHGGIGTAAQGLASGRPQLVMPMTFDQPDCEHDPPACRGRSVTPVGAGGRWPDPQLD